MNNQISKKTVFADKAKKKADKDKTANLLNDISNVGFKTNQEKSLKSKANDLITKVIIFQLKVFMIIIINK